MIAAIHLTLAQVAAALALVAIAAAVSIWQHADLERDIAVATIRSFIQLTAIGYLIKLIFDENNLVFVVALIAAMVMFGALTARIPIELLEELKDVARKKERSLNYVAARVLRRGLDELRREGWTDAAD